MEEYAKATTSTNSRTDQRARVYGAGWAIDITMTGLPQRRAEMKEAINGWLTQTNPPWLGFATHNAQCFPEKFPHWRSI